MITVLRLGHRLPRDARITTHCALVSRAFGASNMFYSGMEDKSLESSVKNVVSKFGNSFKIEHCKNPIKLLRSKKDSKIVHLTMYGVNVDKVIKKIRPTKNIIVIVGGEKVPSEFYKIADYNVAVTKQPHSEVAALAVFLHEYFKGKELTKRFKNAKMRVLESEKGKFLKTK